MKTFSKILICLFGGVIGLAAIAVGIILFIHRPLHQPSFLAQLTVDLEVAGEAVHIERILECKTFKLSDGGEIGLAWGHRQRTEYAVTVGAIGARLNSGGAVMMWTPYRCAHDETIDQRGKTRRRVRPNAPGYLPFIATMPDADDPTVLKIYPSATYFEQPDARVKVLGVEVKDAPAGAEADPRDDFEWFTVTTLIGEKRRSLHLKEGYVAIVLTADQWQGRDPVLDERLASYEKPTLIRATVAAAKVFREVGETRRLPTFLPLLQLRLAIGSDDDLIRDQLILHATDLEFFALHPLQRDGSLLVMRSADRGYIVLDRRTYVNSDRPPIFIRGETRLEPKPDRIGHFLYDPVTEEIFWIISVLYDGFPHKNDPILNGR